MFLCLKASSLSFPCYSNSPGVQWLKLMQWPEKLLDRGRVLNPSLLIHSISFCWSISGWYLQKNLPQLQSLSFWSWGSFWRFTNIASKDDSKAVSLRSCFVSYCLSKQPMETAPIHCAMNTLYGIFKMPRFPFSGTDFTVCLWPRALQMMQPWKDSGNVCVGTSFLENAIPFFSYLF